MTIEEQLAALREEMDALRTELRRARERITLTMRGQTTCPGCGCHKIIHARQILDRKSDGGSAPLSLTQVGRFFRDAVGTLEAYICTDCGLMEWYAGDLSELKLDGQIFSLVEAPEGGGPYR